MALSKLELSSQQIHKRREKKIERNLPKLKGVTVFPGKSQ